MVVSMYVMNHDCLCKQSTHASSSSAGGSSSKIDDTTSSHISSCVACCSAFSGSSSSSRWWEGPSPRKTLQHDTMSMSKVRHCCNCCTAHTAPRRWLPWPAPRLAECRSPSLGACQSLLAMGWSSCQSADACWFGVEPLWRPWTSRASQLNGSCEPTCDWLMTFYINDV